MRLDSEGQEFRGGGYPQSADRQEPAAVGTALVGKLAR